MVKPLEVTCTYCEFLKANSFYSNTSLISDIFKECLLGIRKEKEQRSLKTERGSLGVLPQMSSISDKCNHLKVRGGHAAADNGCEEGLEHISHLVNQLRTTLCDPAAMKQMCCSR